MAKGFFYPGENTTHFRPGSGKFCGDKGGGNKKDKGRQNNEKDGGKAIFSGYSPVFDTPDRGYVDHREHEDGECALDFLG